MIEETVDYLPITLMDGNFLAMHLEWKKLLDENVRHIKPVVNTKTEQLKQVNSMNIFTKRNVNFFHKSPRLNESTNSFRDDEIIAELLLFRFFPPQKN